MRIGFKTLFATINQRRVNIDVGGLGVGVYDRLVELGHSRDLVQAVNFGGKPVEPPALDETGKPAGGPANRRSEMWGNMKKVLEAGRFSLPDSDSLQADLVSCGYKFTSDGKLLLESKQDMRKRGVPSPDEGDAVALCFSEPDGSPFVRTQEFQPRLKQAFRWRLFEDALTDTPEVHQVCIHIKPVRARYRPDRLPMVFTLSSMAWSP